ncbi:ATP-dependent DNA helicase IV, partial [Vagococcus fluvialis]
NLPLVERIQGTKVKLESYWDEYLRKESLKPSVQEEMQHLSEEDQLAYIGKMIPDDPNKLAFYTKKILEKKSATVTKGIRQLRWLDISHLMTVLYKSFTGQDLVRETSSLDYVVTYLLIKHLYVEKLPVFKVEFLLVDEI